MKKQSGFTLVELVVTMVIVGILATIGLPSLRSFSQGGELIAASNELMSALHLARSEAIKSNSRVTVCPANVANTSCSGSTNWEGGWIVFIDADGNLVGTGAACTAPNTDCLLRVQAAYPIGTLAVSGIDDSTNLAISSRTFTSRGLPKTVAGASQSGGFSVCSLDSGGSTTDSRAVVLGFSGRARVSTNAAVTCP